MFSYNMRTSFHFAAGVVMTAAKCRELGSCPLLKSGKNQTKNKKNSDPGFLASILCQLCFLTVSWPLFSPSTWRFPIVRLPYRTLNYKAQKFAMVLSSLDIHGINGSRTTLVFFWPVASRLCSSATVCRTWKWAWNLEVGGSSPSGGALFHIFSLIRGK